MLSKIFCAQLSKAGNFMLTYLIEIRQREFDHGLQIIFQRHVRIAFRLFNIRRNQAASRILNGRFIVSGYCIRLYALL